MIKPSRIALSLSLFVTCLAVSASAQQLIPTRTLTVKNPPAGASRRKITWRVVEQGSLSTIVGDPTANGAQIRIVLTPGGDQCISMPSSGWTARGTGFKYKDRQLLNGPVKRAQIKKTPAGTFLLKVSLSGKGTSPISVLPGNTTGSYGINFEIGGGEKYCTGTGTASPTRNDSKTFKVRNDTTPATCLVLHCSA